MQVLGIDIGGSGIKGAIVDVEKGELITERHRIPTPQPSTPRAFAGVIAELVEHSEWKGPIGCTFPAIVHHGVIKTAANVDDKWIGVDSIKLFEETTGCPVRVINDGDAAGVAELSFGAGPVVASVNCRSSSPISTSISVAGRNSKSRVRISANAPRVK